MGLRIFTTDLDASGADVASTSCPWRRWTRPADRLEDQIESLIPQNGTPLYEATQDAADDHAATPTTRPASTPSCCSPTA